MCTHIQLCIIRRVTLYRSNGDPFHSFRFGSFTNGNKNPIDRGERVERKNRAKNSRIHGFFWQTKRICFVLKYDSDCSPCFPVWTVVVIAIAFVTVSLSRFFFFCWKSYFDYLCRLKYTYNTLKKKRWIYDPRAINTYALVHMHWMHTENLST